MSANTKMILLAVLCPPVAVGLRRGAGTEFFVCVILTVFGVLPGSVYALWELRSAKA